MYGTGGFPHFCRLPILFVVCSVRHGCQLPVVPVVVVVVSCCLPCALLNQVLAACFSLGCFTELHHSLLTILCSLFSLDSVFALQGCQWSCLLALWEIATEPYSISSLKRTEGTWFACNLSECCGCCMFLSCVYVKLRIRTRRSLLSSPFS